MPTVATLAALDDHPVLWLGDGRITAGHLAVLRDRAQAGPFGLILFDQIMRSTSPGPNGAGHFYNLEPRRFAPDPRVRRGPARLHLNRGSLLLDLPGPSEAIAPHRPLPAVPAPA